MSECPPIVSRETNIETTRRSFFIINPEAGNKQRTKLVDQIRELWKRAMIQYEIYITNNLADIDAAVERALKETTTEIIIAGGDGTILAVVKALKGHTMPLGIIPCGNGNDFARAHAIPLETDRALQTILNRTACKTVDVGNCNHFIFLNVASVGIDAAIVKRTFRYKKWLKGSLLYLICSIIEIFLYSPLRVTLTIDGRTLEQDVELIAIANGQYYGGGMKIAPMAESADGLYDVILIRQMSKFRMLRLLPTLYYGSHIHEPEVEIYKGCSIQVRSKEIMLINRDGELTTDKIVDINKISESISIYTNI